MRHPDLSAIFGDGPVAMARQERMLHDALVTVLDHLDDGAWLTATLFALGARHVDLGVRDAMYTWVGDALLATLAEAAGGAWTDEVGVAWADAFRAVREGLLAGAFAARAARAAA